MLRHVAPLALAACLTLPLTPPAAADDTGLAQALHSLRREGGRLCQDGHFHGGSGEGRTKPAALQAALKDWFGYTSGEYGTDWANWNRAADRTVSYTKTSSGWSAYINSRPCK